MRIGSDLVPMGPWESCSLICTQASDVIAAAGDQRQMPYLDLCTGNHDGPRRHPFSGSGAIRPYQIRSLPPRSLAPLSLAIDHADVNRTGIGLG